ncbi:MAG TPA: hypothetical protein VNT60_00355, partial [Deinococcales bacterium]|nr:hypothetical protein [Deinococcales bacterium]
EEPLRDAGEGVRDRALQLVQVEGEAGRAAAVGVLFEGRIVNAASTTDAATLWGQSALADLQRRYAAGLPLDLHELERPVAHALSGVAERLFHAQPADNFSGVQVRGDGDAVLLGAGRPLVVVAAGLSEPGTFPAPLRPPTLTLPGPVGAAAGARYSLTLRGRDAVNPITDVYQRVRSQHGREGIDLLQQLARGLAPTDAAGLNGQDLPAVEKVVEAFLREGLLRREP